MRARFPSLHRVITDWCLCFEEINRKGCESIKVTKLHSPVQHLDLKTSRFGIQWSHFVYFLFIYSSTLCSFSSAWRLRSKSPRRNSRRVPTPATCRCSRRCPACAALLQNLRWYDSSFGAATDCLLLHLKCSDNPPNGYAASGPSQLLDHLRWNN